MKKPIVLLMTLLLFCMACDRDDEKSYSYWSGMITAKYEEINNLTNSVPCTNINEFELVGKNGYYLVHPTVKDQFDRLMHELDRLHEQASKAASREGIMFTSYAEPNPPLRKECVENKPALIYAQQLSLEEVIAEIPIRYQEIITFYEGLDCSDPNDWTGQFLRTGCCFEGVPVHKTIRTGEFIEKMHIFNRLNEVKLSLEKTSCMGEDCARFAKPVQCIAGRPVVELTFN